MQGPVPPWPTKKWHTTAMVPSFPAGEQRGTTATAHRTYPRHTCAQTHRHHEVRACLCYKATHGPSPKRGRPIQRQPRPPVARRRGRRALHRAAEPTARLPTAPSTNQRTAPQCAPPPGTPALSSAPHRNAPPRGTAHCTATKVKARPHRRRRRAPPQHSAARAGGGAPPSTRCTTAHPGTSMHSCSTSAEVRLTARRAPYRTLCARTIKRVTYTPTCLCSLMHPYICAIATA